MAFVLSWGILLSDSRNTMIDKRLEIVLVWAMVALILLLAITIGNWLSIA